MTATVQAMDPIAIIIAWLAADSELAAWTGGRIGVREVRSGPCVVIGPPNGGPPSIPSASIDPNVRKYKVSLMTVVPSEGDWPDTVGAWFGMTRIVAMAAALDKATFTLDDQELRRAAVIAATHLTDSSTQDAKGVLSLDVTIWS